jgi:hypothetical protein
VIVLNNVTTQMLLTLCYVIKVVKQHVLMIVKNVAAQMAFMEIDIILKIHHYRKRKNN